MHTITTKFAACGIAVHFIDQDLSSAEPGFGEMMAVSGNLDDRYMNAHRAKVQRGLRGKVLSGYSTGRGCYGYESAEKMLRVRGSEAETIRRIYSDFASGTSAPQIARSRNADHVSGPRARCWKSRDVYAVLRRPLYRGKRV
jgi:site-specific DNA recombinase